MYVHVHVQSYTCNIHVLNNNYAINVCICTEFKQLVYVNVDILLNIKFIRVSSTPSNLLNYLRKATLKLFVIKAMVSELSHNPRLL